MPHENPDHRFARAAGKATRAFLDGQRQDAERAESARRARAEREADQERIAAERRASTPTALKVARWWWALVTVVFVLLAAAFAVAGLGAPEPAAGPGAGFSLETLTADRSGQFILAGLSGVLAVATALGTVQLLRSRRTGIGLLTGVAVIVGVPLIVRGHPLLIALAAVLLAGAALLWLPAVRRFLR